MPDQAKLDHRNISDYIGVCFDGIDFCFVFMENHGNFRSTDLIPLDENSVSILVEALDKDDRIELVPQNIIDDFGSRSTITASLLNALWKHLRHCLNKKINRVVMLYEEWLDLFAQTTDLGSIGKAKLNSYFVSIGFPQNIDHTQALFILHTYHALFFKLLAAETILANNLLRGVPSDYCFTTSSLDMNELLDSLQKNIEESELFREVNILNFVEGSFFSWYLIQTSSRLGESIRAMMRRLTLYRFTGLRLERTRDIMRQIYQDLVPQVLRHNIGEYLAKLNMLGRMWRLEETDL
jgi:hypothetical protein